MQPTPSSSIPVIGATFSETHRFTPAEVSAFARAMGDTNPLHHDVVVAARSRYGALIVSGTHTTALLMGLTASHFSKTTSVVGIAFGIELRRPVFADAAVILTWTVTAVQPHKGGPAQRVDLAGDLRDGQGRVCVSATGQVLVGLDETPS